MIIRYETREQLEKKQAQAVIAKLMYSVEGITDCHLDPANQEIVLALLPEANREEIETTVNLLIAKERGNRLIGNRICRQSAVDGASARRMEAANFQELIAPDGSVRRDLAVALYESVDGLFAGLARRHQARFRSYPAMIPIRTLQKCGYIHSFPQNIHLVSEIPHRLDALQKVKETDCLDEIARISPFALSPAVCFHCYSELAGSKLREPLILTARGTCCRHEAPWRLGKHRLNEFGMREIVLFGDADFIETTRKQMMEEVWDLFESLGLDGKIETASDPFYFSEESAKGQLQLMGNMKYELVADTGEENGAFSIASFNNMGNALCKPFEVHDENGKPLHSGCVAFGLDRWVYALLSRYGPDLRNFPPAVSAHLERGMQQPQWSR